VRYLPFQPASALRGRVNSADSREAAAMIERLGGRLVETNDRAVVVTGLDEQHRYLVQHTFGYQVHDVDKPHHLNRHGRADVGWPAMKETTP
jgi:hypothetical protein